MATLFIAVDVDKGTIVAASANKGYIRSYIREVTGYTTKFYIAKGKDIEHLTFPRQLVEEQERIKDKNRRKHGKRLARSKKKR